MRPLRRRMQMIFQDPYASLNPRMTVREILAEPLRFHGLTADEAATRRRVDELLPLVGLSPTRRLRSIRTNSRAASVSASRIARALAVSPEFIVADEPISSLDVNIQAQIINLLIDLQERLNLTYLFIAHDLAVVRHISDRIVVLYLGKVMEIASFRGAVRATAASLYAVADLRGADSRRCRGAPPPAYLLQGEPPSALNPPSGCRFRTRCPIAQDICARQTPPLVEHRPGQWAACHFAGQIDPAQRYAS